MIRGLIVGGAVAAALLVVAAGASVAGDDRGRSVAPAQCVSRPLDTTKIVDEQTLYVDDRHGHAVLLHMAGRCFFDPDDAIGLKFYGAERICGPMDVDVTGSVTLIPTTCIIDHVEALTPEQAADYRKRR